MPFFVQSYWHLNISALAEVLSTVPSAWRATTGAVLFQLRSLSKKNRICLQFFPTLSCIFINFFKPRDNGGMHTVQKKQKHPEMLNARDTLLGHNLREGKRTTFGQNRYCAMTKSLVFPVTSRTAGKTQITKSLKC